MTDDNAPARRILVVEDAPVIALDVQEMLEELGWTVVGPIGNLGVALELAAQEPLDAALIDINIRGGKIFPVARILADRQIPFVLASGYANKALPDDLAERPLLEKPYNPRELARKLDELAGGGPAEPEKQRISR
jgi:CheY-like chemotaxis protein